MPLLDGLIGPIASIIDKVIPDKAARERAKLELLQLEGIAGAQAARGAPVGHRRRSAVARPVDQPRPAELPLCDVRHDPLGVCRWV